MKVSFYSFMAHDILEMSSWNIQFSESLVPWVHGPWNTLWQVFMENSGLMNLWSYEIHDSSNKKLPFHGKFMARNKAMKFNFAVFMGHEMPFMGYSLEIHGIFIKMWFIVHNEPHWWKYHEFLVNTPWKSFHDPRKLQNYSLYMSCIS